MNIKNIVRCNLNCNLLMFTQRYFVIVCKYNYCKNVCLYSFISISLSFQGNISWTLYFAIFTFLPFYLYTNEHSTLTLCSPIFTIGIISQWLFKNKNCLQITFPCVKTCDIFVTDCTAATMATIHHFKIIVLIIYKICHYLSYFLSIKTINV